MKRQDTDQLPHNGRIEAGGRCGALPVRRRGAGLLRFIERVFREFLTSGVLALTHPGLSTEGASPGLSRVTQFSLVVVIENSLPPTWVVGTRWHRALKQSEDDRLTGTKYPWLMRPQAMTDAQRATFRSLQRSDLKVARAWAPKERFRQLWGYTYLGAAQRFFARWFWRATHSRLQPMAAVAKLIRRHLPNVLTYLRHRLTNASLEAVNATI